MKKTAKILTIVLTLITIFTLAAFPTYAAEINNTATVNNVPNISEIVETVMMRGGAMLVISFAFVLLIAEMLYIFITAPKCGMSRFWALVPLFSNVLGLLVFLTMRSNQKNYSPKHITVCPTCNCKHPAGTTVCSICGANI